MTDYERRNLEAIDRLNQRGGRMLSLVDLLDAGTLSLDMAAAMAYLAACGGSFLTAAGPGGVGKTTLMGAALAFVRSGAEIITIEGPETLERLPAATPDHPQCLVVHEIGAGPYYGYLWGKDVARYFEAAMAPGRSLASNLHAETYEEAVARITGEPLGASPRALGWVDLLAFMTAARGQRRVTSLWLSDGRLALWNDPRPLGHKPAWTWRAKEDRFDLVGPPPADTIGGTRGLPPPTGAADLARFGGFLAKAQAAGVRQMADLRRRALAEGLLSRGL